MLVDITQFETKIYPDGNEVLIIRFNFYGKEQFTYLTKKSLEYWTMKGVKIEDIQIGTKINVIEIPNLEKKQYKIIKFFN